MPVGDLTPNNYLEGGTDGTKIGNVGDRLKVQQSMLVPIHSHHTIMIELGRSFSVDHISTVNAGSYHQHVLTTPNSNRLCYLTLFATTSEEAEISIYEVPTVTLGASLASEVINQNRNSSNVATSTLHDVTTVTAVGALISQYRLSMGSGKGNNPALGQDSSVLILKKNTQYLLRWKSLTNGNVMSTSTRFFEYDESVDNV